MATSKGWLPRNGVQHYPPLPGSTLFIFNALDGLGRQRPRQGHILQQPNGVGLRDREYNNLIRQCRSGSNKSSKHVGSTLLESMSLLDFTYPASTLGTMWKMLAM